jgi:O-antigen/teichoic acid export membrane protein
VLSLARGVLAVAGVVVGVTVLGRGAQGYLGGLLAGTALVAIPVLAVRLATGPPRRDLVVPLLRFGVPLVPAGLSIWLLSSSDVYLLKLLTGLQEVGQYQFAHELLLVMVLPIMAFHMAWPSFLYRSLAAGEEGERAVVRIGHVFVLGLIGLGLAVSLLAPAATAWVGGETYGESARVIPVLTLSVVLYGVFLVVSSGLYAAKATRRLPLIALVAAVVNILLDLVWIPRLGYVGAGMASAVANLALVLLAHRSAQSVRALAFPTRSWAVLVTVAAAMGVAPRLAPDAGGPLPWLLRGVLLAIGVTVLVREGRRA